MLKPLFWVYCVWQSGVLVRWRQCGSKSLLLFPFVFLWSCKACLHLTIHLTPALRFFYRLFFFFVTSEASQGGVVALNMFPLLCNVVWVVESLQNRSGFSPSTGCPSVYHADFALKQKTPSNSCDHSCMNTGFFPVLPKAIMNILLKSVV